jgi:hypothetical protein
MLLPFTSFANQNNCEVLIFIGPLNVLRESTRHFDGTPARALKPRQEIFLRTRRLTPFWHPACIFLARDLSAISSVLTWYAA